MTTDDARSARAHSRLRKIAVRACGSEEAADLLMEGLRAFVASWVHLLHHDSEAPNFLTVTYETPEDHYEVTVRRLGGTTPADRIAALEQENYRLKRRIWEATEGGDERT